MKLQLLKFWDRLWGGFWFLPACMATGAVVVSYATVALDARLAARGLPLWDWVYTGGAEGASAVLTAISGSMITLAGLVFSLTLVSMSLAASNFGPRLLQNFMRDTANQIVLGTFVATFLYGLLVLRTIRRADEGPFVPHVSVSLAMLFALASLGVLIYFIHHVAVSIQADEIIARVGRELAQQVHTLFPERIGRRPSLGSDSSASPEKGPDPSGEGVAVSSEDDGYLQLVDADGILQAAIAHDAVFRLDRRPGQYVVAGESLLHVWPRDRMNDELVASLRSAFVLGSQRTATQDLEYLVGQLVEIAVRALSPSVNDPFTAIACVDRLSSALTSLAGRQMPSAYRYDDAGNLRVIAEGVTFDQVLRSAFDPIRRYSRANVEVSLRLLDSLASVASVNSVPARTILLRRHAAAIARGRRGLVERADRDHLLRHYRKVVRKLKQCRVGANRGQDETLSDPHSARAGAPPASDR